MRSEWLAPNERARASISIKINNLIKITTVKVSDLHVWVFCLSMQDNFIGYGIGLSREKKPIGFEIVPPTWRVGRL